MFNTSGRLFYRDENEYCQDILHNIVHYSNGNNEILTTTLT